MGGEAPNTQANPKTQKLRNTQTLNRGKNWFIGDAVGGDDDDDDDDEAVVVLMIIIMMM